MEQAALRREEARRHDRQPALEAWEPQDDTMEYALLDLLERQPERQPSSEAAADRDIDLLRHEAGLADLRKPELSDDPLLNEADFFDLEREWSAVSAEEEAVTGEYREMLLSQPEAAAQAEASLMKEDEEAAERPDRSLIRTELSSDLPPEEQLELHKQELERLVDLYESWPEEGEAGGMLPGVEDEASSYEYEGTFQNRRDLELAIRDQAEIVRLAELLVEHRDNLQDFAAAVDQEFGEEYGEGLVTYAGDDREGASAWRMPREEGGQPVPGSRIRLEHSVDSQGERKLNITIDHTTKRTAYGPDHRAEAEGAVFEGTQKCSALASR